MQTTSLWEAQRPAHFASLKKDVTFDVAVVGGGITGLTAAYLLKKAGKRVCVLERDRLGDQDTGHTTAHLTYVTDVRLSTLVKNFGKPQARLVWAGGAAAINTIQQIARTLEADCQFKRVPGFLHAAWNGKEDECDELRSEAELARELGFDGTYLDSVPWAGKPGIRFANQAKFHPLAYLRSLAAAVEGDGSAIYEEVEVETIDSSPPVIHAHGRQIRCGYVVIATHTPLMGQSGLASAALLQTKLAPYSSYAVSASLPAGEVPEASFWDTSDPYYYLRIDSGAKRDEAIFGGEDHKTGQASDTEARYKRLEHMLQELIPEARIDHHWSGQVVETNDGLPYIGETTKEQFVATGFSGNGMTFGTLGGMMATDAILARENPWQDLFDVSRKKLRGGVWDYLKENFDYPYYLVKDHLAPTEGSSPADVAPGEGKILRIEGKRVACYRDEQGNITKVSANCTHMGCVVHWNQAETTWDCPCHGSRFKATGEVMAGPAEAPLDPC